MKKMSNRMTSTAIQERHPEVYESFFASHDLVISVPEILNWGYGACRRDNPKVRIQQQMPTRMYLGISPSSIPGVHFQDVYGYDFHGSTFETLSFGDVYKGKIAKRLHETCEHRLGSTNYDGVTISLLSEFRRGNGSGFTSSLCLLYALFIFIVTSDVDIQQLRKNELLKVWELALKIDTAVFYPHSLTHDCGFLPYVSLQDSDFPMAYNGGPLFQNNRFHVDQKVLHEKIIDTKELVGNAELGYMGFEYAVLDGGGRYYSDHIRKKHETLFMCDEKPFSKTLYQDLTTHDVLKTFTDIQEYHCQKSLYILLGYLSSQTESNLHKALTAFGDLGSIYQSKQRGKDFQALFISKFNALVDGKEKVALMPINCTNGEGRTFCIAKAGVLRKTLPVVLEQLRADMNNDIRIVYSSWRDGGSFESVRVNQFISAKKYSSYVDKDTVLFTDAQGNKKITSFQDAFATCRSGFFLDGVSKKIWYNGERLTSKDLVSQSTTVDVLLMLFQHLNKDISNKSLERSSYSRNKNEMLSKVVLPFKKFVQEHTNQILPLECKGGLYDYMIRLNKTNIPFSSVSRVGEGMMVT